MAAFEPEQDTARTTIVQGVVSLALLVALVLVFHARGASWPVAVLEGVAADVALTMVSLGVIVALGLFALGGFFGFLGMKKANNFPVLNMTGPPRPM